MTVHLAVIDAAKDRKKFLQKHPEITAHRAGKRGSVINTRSSLKYSRIRFGSSS